MTPERRTVLPEFLRFLLGHCLVGAGIGLAGAIAIVWFDVAGIGSLVAGGAGAGWIAVGLLCFGFVVTFGSLAMGSAIFMLAGTPDRDDEDGGHERPERRQMVRALAPIRRRRPSR
ncbi:MAG: hypothetical protein JNK67_18755 [Alphaproteobacteria bacterium]|nr:hypothetical protein [Alphaproteobacteria bacterium]